MRPDQRGRRHSWCGELRKQSAFVRSGERGTGGSSCSLLCTGRLPARVETEALARGTGVSLGWQLTAAKGAQVLWLLILALPLVVGANLAYDRSTGHLLLQRARGASSATIAAGRLAAAALLALAAVAVTLSALLVAAVVAIPRAASVGSAVGFEPRLLDASPAAWLALVGGIQSLAATVVLTGSLFVGWLVAAPRVAKIGPPLFVLGLGFAMTGPLSRLNPLERVSFLDLYGVSWTKPDRCSSTGAADWWEPPPSPCSRRFEETAADERDW